MTTRIQMFKYKHFTLPIFALTDKEICCRELT